MNAITLENGQSPTLGLQAIQHDHLLDYSYEIFTRESFDFREIALAQAMYGCFWKNPYIYDEFTIFDDLFAGFEETSRLRLVCLLENAVDECRRPVNTFPWAVQAQKEMDDGSLSELVFLPGRYEVAQDCIRFRTVLDYKFTTFQYHDALGPEEEEDDALHTYETFTEVQQWNKTDEQNPLPDISSSEPDTWWMASYVASGTEYRDWYLVNYKEKKIFVGPKGIEMDLPESIDLMGLEIWGDEEEFDEDDYYSEDSDENEF
jgi:hypothetical protein